jgi:16S rRNA (adenine1518-N6/adenine1519-N6)-dimethyltransferase
MRRVPAPPGAERAIELARAGFGQRRKMLRRSLSTILDDPVVVLEEAGIDPTWRAENLSPDDFLRLADVS